MSSLKTQTPTAARTKQLLSVDDMTGGVDLRRSQTLLNPKNSRTLLNWSLEEPGALIVRKGYQAASSVTFGSNPQGGQRVYLASTVFTIMAIDGAVYKPSDAWVKGAAVYSTISSAAQVYFPYDRDLVAVLDGTQRPRFSTNGTTWNLMGTDAPSSAAVLSSLSTGGLSSGEYGVSYTYKHRGTGHESNGSSESTVTLSSSGAIGAVASPSTDGKVDAYVWYARHKAPDGESVLRKVSSGAASTITITSSAWTSADEIPTNHSVPPALTYAAIWKSRWWAKDATQGNRIRFTELFQPQSWPTLYYIDIPFEKGDSITAIQPLGDTLIIYGQSGGYLIIGQTALDFEVRPSQGINHGSIGFRAVAKVEQASLHVSGDGIDSFDGAGDRDLVHDITPAWRDLVTNATQLDLSKIAVAYDDIVTHELRISVPRVYPTAARGEWVLNLDRTRDNSGVPAWTTTDRDIAFFIQWNGNEPNAGDRGKLFSIPSTGGFVYQESVEAAANSSAMRAEYEGAGLTLGAHRARVCDAHVQYEPHGGAFSIEAVIDGVSQGSIPLQIGTGLNTYGNSQYGSATYGGSGRRKAYTPLPLSANGRTIVTKFVYIGRERMKIYTHAYGILPEPSPLQMGE